MLKSRYHVGLKHTLGQLKNQAMSDLTNLLIENQATELRVNNPFCRFSNDDHWTVDAEKIMGIRAIGATDAEILIEVDTSIGSYGVPMTEFDADTLVALIEQLEKDCE